MQQPSVGRIVHYTSHGSPVRDDGTQEYPSVCRAAIVTEVPAAHPHDEHGPRVALAVLNPTGIHFDRTVAHDEEHRPGTWHWPERTGGVYRGGETLLVGESGPELTTPEA